MSMPSMTTIRDSALRLYARMKVRGSKHVVAVFVTPIEIFWVQVDCRDYQQHLTRCGQHEIGRYNSRVAFDDLLDDMTCAAAELGRVDA